MNDHPRVICLGEILWDCLADQPGSRDQVQSWTSYPGGAPANVACALARLDIPSAFIGCIGGDEAGEKLVEILRSRSVNTAGIQRYLKGITRQVEVLRTPEGDRQFIGFRDSDGEFADLPFADLHLQAQFLPTELFNTAEYLIIGTITLAHPEPRNATQRALELAQTHAIKTLLDINWRSMFWPDPDQAKPLILETIAQVNFLKLAFEEALWLFDMSDAQAIAQRFQLDGVLITHGDKGCTYSFHNHPGHQPSFAVEVEDTTGAGDAFVAGFISQLCRHGLAALENPDLAKQIITYANAVGAIVTTDAGAIAPQPTHPEVEAFFYLNKIRE
jgi:fructokinase